MKTKSLLLGSAAALAFAGSQAQAADLSIAEPVDYVRVCDAFGSGYWYIPGTDTCLRIGGSVQFDIDFEEIDTTDDHNKWDFETTAVLQVEARSMTDWGPLVSFMEFEGVLDDTAADPTLEEAWLSLGPITAGFFQSSFDWGGGYANVDGLDDGFGAGTAFTDNKLNQVQLSWAMNGFGLILALEEGEARAEDWNPEHGSSTGLGLDLVAAITSEGAGWNAKLAFLYGDRDDGHESVWGVQGGVEFTELFGGSDSFMIAGSHVNDEHEITISSIMLSYEHFWQSNLSSAINVQYNDHDFGSGWAVAFQTKYLPVENFEITGAIAYIDDGEWEDYYDVGGDDDNEWKATVRLERFFGE